MGSPPDRNEAPQGAERGTRRRRFAVEQIRYVSIVGAATALLLSAVTYLWALGKAVAFVQLLIAQGLSSDQALVTLFESIDSILIATVLLIVGFGTWELFIHDLHLPAALTTHSIDQLKQRIAGTLLLVLVVRFLEFFVTRTAHDEILALGISTALVGFLLLAYSNWNREA